MSDEPYYHILLRDGELIIACQQWFDEFDYDNRERLFGNIYFDSEETARIIVDGMYRWLGQHVVSARRI